MTVDETTSRVVVRLPAAPDSISTARSAARRALVDWDLDHLVETAQLLVSELATNAVLHARTDLEVVVELRDAVVRVSVADDSSRPVARRRYGLDSGTGRGLGLVDTLATSWGTETSGAWAKTVWFELDRAGAEEPDEGALYGEDWLALVDDL